MNYRFFCMILSKHPTSRLSQELTALDFFIALLFLRQVFDVFSGFVGLYAEHELFNVSMVTMAYRAREKI